MSIPLATTLIDVNSSSTGDGSDPVTPTVVSSGVRAHFSSPQGDSTPGREQVDMLVDCDPCPLESGQVVHDLHTGDYWHVVWADNK